jgi:hypothetical protein
MEVPSGVFSIAGKNACIGKKTKMPVSGGA